MLSNWSHQHTEMVRTDEGTAWRTLAQCCLKPTLFSPSLCVYTWGMFMYVHMWTGAQVCVWVIIHICTYTGGEQRILLTVGPQVLSTFIYFFGGNISYWPGTHQVTGHPQHWLISMCYLPYLDFFFKCGFEDPSQVLKLSQKVIYWLSQLHILALT